MAELSAHKDSSGKPQEVDIPKLEWVLREGAPDDEQEILKCREACFPGEDPDKLESGFWKWEFLDNHAGPARFFIAEVGDRVVGHYGVIPQRFITNGKSHNGSIVVDVMTHPDFRRQGMFTAIGKYSIEACTKDPELEFTTGYPIRPEVIPGHLNVGWKIRFKIGSWILPISCRQILDRWFSKVPGLSFLLGLLPTLGASIWSWWFLSRKARGTVERKTTCDVAAFQEFWNRFKDELPASVMIQERTPEFLMWRYDNNPFRNHFYHLLRDSNGDLAGYAVSRVVSLLGVRTVVVLDCLTLATGKKGLSDIRTLLADVRRYGVETTCGMVAMMVTQPNPLMQSPWRLGFIPSPYRFTFITKEYCDQPVIDDPIEWHLMWGDTDDL